jgi:hypothetical protein
MTARLQPKHVVVDTTERGCLAPRDALRTWSARYSYDGESIHRHGSLPASHDLYVAYASKRVEALLPQFTRTDP